MMLIHSAGPFYWLTYMGQFGEIILGPPSGWLHLGCVIHETWSDEVCCFTMNSACISARRRPWMKMCVQIYCGYICGSLSSFCALPGLPNTSVVSLQAVRWLCQRGRLRELCCQAEGCSGEWCCIPQGFLLVQWLWPPYEALRTPQWGLVCEGVNMWLPVVLPCTDNLPTLCPCPL